VTVNEAEVLLLLIAGFVVLMLSKLPEKSAPKSLKDTFIVGDGKSIISFVES